MDKITRGDLIRTVHKAKLGCMAYRPSGKPRKPNTDPVESRGFGVWGKGGLKRTFYVPEAGSRIFGAMPEKETGPRVKRSQGESALTVISVKAAHKKLVRPFATAEALLAERARQSRP